MYSTTHPADTHMVLAIFAQAYLPPWPGACSQRRLYPQERKLTGAGAIVAVIVAAFLLS